MTAAKGKPRHSSLPGTRVTDKMRLVWAARQRGVPFASLAKFYGITTNTAAEWVARVDDEKVRQGRG